jgi:hypothetical protein
LKLIRQYLVLYPISSHHSHNATSQFWIPWSRKRAMSTAQQTWLRMRDSKWGKNFSENAEERNTVSLVSKTWSVQRILELAKLVMMSLISSFNHLASSHLISWPLEKSTVLPFLA